MGYVCKQLRTTAELGCMRTHEQRDSGDHGQVAWPHNVLLRADQPSTRKLQRKGILKQPAPTAAFPQPHPPRAAGNYTLQLSAWNAIGESAPTTASSSVEVAFSTKPRFWSVQGSQAEAELRVIRPDSVAEPDNLRYQVAILRAGDSGSGYFREAAPETPSGNGSLVDPAVFTIPLYMFGDGVEYAQV